MVAPLHFSLVGLLQEAYLTALRGLLLTSGQRLSAPVLSKAGEALQSMMTTAGVQHTACYGCKGSLHNFMSSLCLHE